MKGNTVFDFGVKLFRTFTEHNKNSVHVPSQVIHETRNTRLSPNYFLVTICDLPIFMKFP